MQFRLILIMNSKCFVECHLSVQIDIGATVHVNLCLFVSVHEFSQSMISVKCICFFKHLPSPAFRDGWWQQLAASGRVAFDHRRRLMV